MSETFVLDTVARFVGGTEDAELRISNAGTGTIYYDNEKTVSSSSNDGSVAAGATAARRAPTWIVATTQTPVTITRLTHAEDSHNVHGYEGDFADIVITQEAPINVQWAPYGATGDGSTDDTVAIQAAITAATAAGGGMIYLPPATYKVTSLNLAAETSLKGDGPEASRLLGTNGSDVIVLPSAGGVYMHSTVEGLTIDGGRRGLRYSVVASSTYCVEMTIRDCKFYAPQEECIYTEGELEEWHLDGLRLEGGTYGFRHANVDSTNADNYIDKSTFTNVLTAGGTTQLNGWRMEGRRGQSNTWTNCIINTSLQHGFYCDGAWRSLVFINVNFEGVGQNGKSNRTTLSGTVNSGATSGTLASATGWVNGDPIVIKGAGAAGVDLFTTVTSLAGTSVGWTTATGTTVTDPKVTNGSYDEMQFAASIAQAADITLFAASIAGETAGGHLRYAVDARNVLGNFKVDALPTEDAVPVYDPGGVVRPEGRAWLLRRPSLADITISPTVALLDGQRTLGALDHDGTTVGFYGITPATRPTAITQTYSTATRTHSNNTAADLVTTATTQTTPYGFSSQAQGDAIATQVNALRVDLNNVRGLLNSVVDDLQSLGLEQ